MRVDDGETPIIHHRQGHDDAHKPTVLPDGLGYGPGQWVLKGADAHEQGVTDSRQGEKWK
ncbi:hypothetical protein C0V73_21210 [Rhizobium sp. TH135]|nr:hypothetical protein C0V73_21210 [Rhizobium sp. TH135]